MDVLKAIKQAVKFCAKGPEAPVTHKSIRFTPKGKHTDAEPALYVHNGDFGMSIRLDSEVPNCVLDAEVLIQMAKEVKAGVALGGIDNLGYGSFQFNLTGGKAGDLKYKVPSLEISEWESFNVRVPDTYTPMPHWWVVQKVIHAASKDPEHMLSTVKFTENYVEATDQIRIARAEVAFPWKGLLPASMFANWPKTGDVSVAVTADAMFFQVGDEMRFSKFVDTLHPQYPDCSELIPQRHDGPEAVAPVSGLKEILKRAVAVSPTNLVTVLFDLGRMAIRSYQEGESSRFEGDLDVPCNGPGELLIDGKMILESLTQMDTPNVRLCFGGPLHPLRLESAHHVECVWPWRV